MESLDLISNVINSLELPSKVLLKHYSISTISTENLENSSFITNLVLCTSYVVLKVNHVSELL